MRGKVERGNRRIKVEMASKSRARGTAKVGLEIRRRGEMEGGGMCAARGGIRAVGVVTTENLRVFVSGNED